MQQTGVVRSRYKDELPPVAGLYNSNEGEKDWNKWDLQPETPVVKVDDKRKFGGGAVRSSDHVPDVLKHPGSSSELSALMLKMKDDIYASTKREALGKAYVRGHKLPDKVKSKDFKFGVRSDQSEAAKSLIYPQPTEEENCGLELYRRSHHAYMPGEQRLRDYKWDVDVKSHTFGRSGGGIAYNGASPNVAEVFNGKDDEEAARVSSKRIEDFSSRQHRLGRARNLGMGTRAHLGPEHIYGMPAAKANAELEGDVRACVEGEYTWEEQQPDKDLGIAFTPGFRNVTTDSRAFGVPSIRTDIVNFLPPERRSVADNSNYPDDANAACLVNPGQFATMGIEEDLFFLPRTKSDLKSLFDTIGSSYDEEVFDVFVHEASKQGQALDGKASLYAVQLEMRNYEIAKQMGNEHHWRKERGL